VSYLLDTNVISEWEKPRPELRVIRWFDQVDEDSLFLSAVVLAELRYGAERLAEGVKRRRLEVWIAEELIERFEGRILNVDPAVANAWGILMARSEAGGKRMHAMDGFLAATAEVHQLTLVTRNVEDFRMARCSVVSPWIDDESGDDKAP
jgi:toxin FitB